MIIETKNAAVAVAILVAAGVILLELTRGATLVGSTVPGTAAYSASRVTAAFEAVAGMPQTTQVRVPMATKGDLPVPLGCRGMQSRAEVECMDVTYEIRSEPSIVVETRFGNTSTLMRMDSATLAEAAWAERPLRSE